MGQPDGRAPCGARRAGVRGRRSRCSPGPARCGCRSRYAAPGTFTAGCRRTRTIGRRSLRHCGDAGAGGPSPIVGPCSRSLQPAAPAIGRVQESCSVRVCGIAVGVRAETPPYPLESPDAPRQHQTCATWTSQQWTCPAAAATVPVSCCLPGGPSELSCCSTP